MSLTRPCARTLVRGVPAAVAIAGLWLAGCAPEASEIAEAPAPPVAATAPAAGAVAPDAPPPVDPPSPVAPAQQPVVPTMGTFEERIKLAVSEVARALDRKDFDALRLYMAPEFAMRVDEGDWEVLPPDEALSRIQTQYLVSDLPVIAAEDLYRLNRIKADPAAMAVLGEDTNFTVYSGLGWGPEGKDEGTVIVAIDKDIGVRWIGVEIGPE